MKLPQLSLMARAGLERLTRAGVVPDWDDVAALQALGLAMERPETGGPALSVLGCPVKVGNVTLWPWSIGAGRWYKERAAAWFAEWPEVDLLALAFSHCNSHSPAVLSALVTREETVKALTAWAEQCGATVKELSGALDCVLPPGGPDGKGVKACPECGRRLNDNTEADLPPPPDSAQWLDLVGALMQAFPGTGREYWTWTEPESGSMRLLRLYSARQRAMGAEMDGTSPVMLATHAFESALRQIKAKHGARLARAAVSGPGNDTASPGATAALEGVQTATTAPGREGT